MDSIRVKGIVKRILYPRSKNTDSDFTVAILERNGIEVTIKGNMYGLKEKEEVLIEGQWHEDKKYGQQLQVLSWERPVPNTKEQALDLLSSSFVRGCGKKTAKLIVEALGDNAIEVIQRDGEACLRGIKGIGKKNAAKIVVSLNENYGIQNILKHLGKYGITVNMATKLLKEFKSNAVNVIMENPYELICLRNVGFDMADAIAKKIDIEETSRYRCEAAVIHILKEHSKDGHCYTAQEDLKQQCVELLNKRSVKKISIANIQWALEFLYKRGKIKIEDQRVYLRKVYEQESLSACKLIELSTSGGEAMPKSRIANEIMQYQKKHRFILNAKQQEAIYEIINRNVLVLTGAPGTGKTLTTRAIVEIYRKLFPDNTIALCAPTGRASQNLSEIVGIPWLEGQTIHRLLNWGVRPSEDDEEVDSSFMERDEDNPFKESFFIVDESSMMDIELLHCFIRAVKQGAKVLFVGDPDQLPSVGAGAVLRDIINSPIPHVRLTEVYRQAKNSLIIENAHRINRGEMVITDSTRKDFLFIDRSDAESTLTTILSCVKRLLELGYKTEDILILSPIKKGVVGTLTINEKVRQLVNPASSRKKELYIGEKSFRVGDIIIQNQRNNVDRGLYNGNMGIVKDICNHPYNDEDKELGLLCIINKREVFLTKRDIGDYDFSTAYSITTHKSQGGQAKVVIAPVVSNHYIMLTRNIVYTAETRAQEMMIMIGQKRALAMAIKNVQPNLRRTYLAERIAAQYKEKAYKGAVIG